MELLPGQTEAVLSVPSKAARLFALRGGWARWVQCVEGREVEGALFVCLLLKSFLLCFAFHLLALSLLLCFSSLALASTTRCCSIHWFLGSACILSPTTIYNVVDKS